MYFTASFFFFFAERFALLPVRTQCSKNDEQREATASHVRVTKLSPQSLSHQSFA